MFHKAITKSIPFLLSAVLATCPMSLKTSAAAYKYRFVTNLSDIGIYYSDTYASYYGERTMRAAFEWRADSRLGFIYPKRVSSSSTCQVQCRMYSAQNDGVYAATTYYYGAFDYAHNLNPDSKNWDRCIIKVNNSYNVELSTLIHEFGHVLGLGHDTNPSSIMCKSGSGRVAISPSYSDYTLVYQKYAPYVS